MNALARTSLALLALALPRAAQEPGSDLPERVEATLAEVARPADIRRAADRLARLGPGVLAPLFDRLCADAPEIATRRAALLGAFGLLPREQVLAFLTGLARSNAAERRREAALDLLARLGGRAELTLVLELGSPPEPGVPAGPALRAAFEKALLGICSREESAPRALAGLFARAGPGMQASIVSVLARGEDAASQLAGLLGSAGVEADALLLLEISEAARDAEPCNDLIVFERVRGYLGHPEAGLVVLACLATDQLCDHGAVPDLIVLLGDARENVRTSAHTALVGLTGASMPPDAQTWIAWLDAGLAWWDERAESCRVALVSGTAAEAAAALQEVAEQRLFAHEVVQILELAIQRPEVDIVRSAGRALGALHPRTARSTLLVLAEHSDPAVAERARLSLERTERPRPLPTRTRQAHFPTKSRIQ